MNRSAIGPLTVNQHDEQPVRKSLVLTGILQGIGFRPTVFRLATGLGLAGWVVNTTSGVRIEIEGPPGMCERFLLELPGAIPFPGRIDQASQQDIPPVGEQSFRIDASVEGARLVTPIPPDVAVCPECVAELLDTQNRRYLYPFITCTLCGPRFTVVRSFPYDRERTSMADFTMCPRCGAEYHDPHDRRFHSQTNSCPECGPRVTLTDNSGRELAGDPVEEAINLLIQGKILGVKGVGGFHLACDALNENAVQLLRQRKGRAEKPFAVMMPDMETIRRYCEVTEPEEALLTSPVAPIVLLEASDRHLAPCVAPLMGTLGVMLPYSPLHHLLFKHPRIPVDERLSALVMTSGNRSEEPIAAGNDEAIERLRDLVDAFVLHDREIVLRADDSIYRVIAGRPTVFRRSRGIVPGEFALERTGKPKKRGEEVSDHSPSCSVVLGSGGDLKNALAIVKGDHVVPGPHVGDLASPVSQEYFKKSVEVLTGYLEATPHVIAVDPHPEYFSTILAKEMQIPVEEVYHHHAHAVSLLFQHGLQDPALFAVFDGTGYGTDGTIWGGEFLIADLDGFTRAGHLSTFSLPGGEAAIREPLRILAALLARDGQFPAEFATLFGDAAGRIKLWLEAVKKGLNSPVTSSAGRLFDAAAAAAGFRRPVTFEGQAAMWLEGVADPAETGSYPIEFISHDPVIVDVSALIRHAATDLMDETEPQRVSARFHNSVASLIAETLQRISRRTGLKTVGLTGGCFQNKLLTERTLQKLKSEGFNVLLHDAVSPNDGGIAVGQAVAALRRRGLSSGGTL